MDQTWWAAEWPPRLPDLTALDFFLYGEIKKCIYKVPVLKTGNKMRQKIL